MHNLTAKMIDYEIICKKCKKEFRVYHDYLSLRDSPNKLLSACCTNCKTINRFPARNKNR